ncbi:uncharacterized protein LOC131677975 isoform X1 [Topomyia yanbarensis]|uniref:uncharacterized protein LOC131677975 isoform X1 n=1 Tax=Topomyia yanbarensis TaxID=2498891 RepID=UPI00273CBCDA|nr:uncharacterized protein LOC131677975 isoform X1 [Topomyia yanbarensis]
MYKIYLELAYKMVPVKQPVLRTHSLIPGCTAACIMEALDPPATVQLLQPTFTSRPGPVCGSGERVFQTSYCGKYPSIQNNSSAEMFPDSSSPLIVSYKHQMPLLLPANRCCLREVPSPALLHTSYVISSLRSPGRTLAASREEALSPPITVEPFLPATSSRPGPVVELGRGVFRKPTSENLIQYVTTMVCVAIKGIPAIGVIHSPFTRKTVWAWVDKAISEPMDLLKRDEDVKHPVIIVSRSHSGEVKNIAKEVFGANSHIIPAGGAGYKVLQVLYNNATAYIHSTAIKKWDICAGSAILAAVGGKMTNLKNQDISYTDKDSFVNENGLLATAAESIHELYIAKIIEQKLLI